MIVYPARHWFEALRPTLEPKEKEIFYQHPTLPLKVNQIGVVYFEDDDAVFEGLRGILYRIKMKREGHIDWSYVSIGTRARACYESYHNVICTGRHFMFIDGNPLNCTKENIIPIQAPPKTKDPEGFLLHANTMKTTKRFVKASVDWMIEKERWVINKGGNTSHYWELFGELPTWLQAARKKQGGLSPNFLGNKITRNTSDVSDDLKDKIVNLYFQGMTPKKIAEDLDMTLPVTQKIIKKLRLSRR